CVPQIVVKAQDQEGLPYLADPQAKSSSHSAASVSEHFDRPFGTPLPMRPPRLHSYARRRGREANRSWLRLLPMPFPTHVGIVFPKARDSQQDEWPDYASLRSVQTLLRTPLFCVSRIWSLPSGELAAILSWRNSHDPATPPLYP